MFPFARASQFGVILFLTHSQIAGRAFLATQPGCWLLGAVWGAQAVGDAVAGGASLAMRLLQVSFPLGEVYWSHVAREGKKAESLPHVWGNTENPTQMGVSQNPLDPDRSAFWVSFWFPYKP